MPAVASIIVVAKSNLTLTSGTAKGNRKVKIIQIVLIWMTKVIRLLPESERLEQSGWRFTLHPGRSNATPHPDRPYRN